MPDNSTQPRRARQVLAKPLPEAAGAAEAGHMWTINITYTEVGVEVRVNRWRREGRYPAPLAGFLMSRCDGESELAMLGRVGRAVELEMEARRLEEYPELPIV